MKKKLKKIAEKIVELEKEMKTVSSTKEESLIEQEIMQLISNCSIEDMIEIDDFILRLKLLTK